MALPSSQPVTSLVCGDDGRLRRGSSRQAGLGGVRAAGVVGAAGWGPLRGYLGSRQPPTPACRAHQVPGVAGALSGLGVPATPLKGQDHVPALVAIEHRVSGRDVDVEELGWAARLFHADQVRQHMVACGRGVQSGKNCYSPPPGSLKTDVPIQAPLHQL